MQACSGFGASRIRPNCSTQSARRASMTSAAPASIKKNPAAKIRITGHCDERGSDDYNITLGMKRATAAKEYLVRVGIDPARIDVSSLGREKPIDPSSNEGAWARNRRGEFEVTAGGQVLQAP